MSSGCNLTDNRLSLHTDVTYDESAKKGQQCRRSKESCKWYPSALFQGPSMPWAQQFLELVGVRSYVNKLYLRWRLCVSRCGMSPQKKVCIYLPQQTHDCIGESH
uniref:Uncharacterized protein n=1 Tax=Rhipicephalus zambeziensis TaxID=60191 RepID=A0A224YBZ1_9ACAR